MKGYGVGRDIISNYKSTLSVAYIIVPDNFKGEGREKYIQDCYRRERVSVMYEGGGLVKHDCFITTEALYNVRFPEKTISEEVEKGASVSRLGSMVVVFNEPYHDQVFVIGTISKLDESNMFQENEFRVVRGKNGNFALVNINGKSGSINISTFGSVSHNGNFSINVSNQNDDAECSLGVRGNVTVNVTGDVSLVSKGKVDIKPLQLTIGEENIEPAVKGHKIEEQLNKEKKALTDLINAIKNLVALPVPANAVDPTWASLQAILSVIVERADYSQVKSDKLFFE